MSDQIPVALVPGEDPEIDDPESFIVEILDHLKYTIKMGLNNTLYDAESCSYTFTNNKGNRYCIRVTKEE